MEAEISSTTPLKEAIKETGNVTTCLYRLSITIQNPSSQNRLERMEKIDMGYYESFDIQHVGNKYEIGLEYHYLIERLGKANTKRGQTLKYNEEHHERIVGRRDAMESVGGSVGEEAEPNEDDFFSEGPSAVQTNISTVYEGNAEFSREEAMEVEYVAAETIDADRYSEVGFSQTSYALSTYDIESTNLRVPDPPIEFGNVPFQCPYCFRIVEINNRVSWK
jgi:hypothetical protein